FGDGNKTETLVGFTSHVYDSPGKYSITVPVTNSEGGIDSATTDIFVNGIPVIILDLPLLAKAGESVIIDASASYDPEGGQLLYEWDSNLSKDSDGNGNPVDDIDFTESMITLPTTESGLVMGRLKIIDDVGASVTKDWEVDINTRNFEVRWVKRIREYSWSGNLKTGEEWNSSHIPSFEGILSSINATLVLTQDGNLLGDENFTLSLEVPNDSWAADAESTRQTPAEEAKAIIFREDMNNIPNGTQIYSSDSKEILTEILFDDTSIFGTGDWVWEVYSKGLDSGLPFEFPDGIDPGNDWTLHLTFEVYEPVIVELAYLII
ncbi:MAG TPA: PKD domain-containing protein, partial [Candidatus Poseidoniaceae archaeon]|nr:PKD domain-containing protein [Candidatus Poseidoniaceae archaeon]